VWREGRGEVAAVLCWELLSLRRRLVSPSYTGGVVRRCWVCWEKTDPEELAQCGIVWLARLALDVFLESSQSMISCLACVSSGPDLS
jgi:hypothetical protein